jgi:hypothetical protein
VAGNPGGNEPEAMKCCGPSFISVLSKYTKLPLLIKVPRASLAELRLKTKRQTPVDILLTQAKSRIPHYVPIRHARMADNPFAFFRGGAAIFAHDIAKTPSPNIAVQLCGDMHVSNFGFFFNH